MSFRTFFVGLHQPADAKHFDFACISIRRLWGRKKPLGSVQVLVDSGAFMELLLHGQYRESVDTYATELHRLHVNGVVNIVAAVAQDFMCEAFMLEKTGLTVADHQRLTIERYDALVAALKERFGGAPPFPVLPVLQGYSPADYVAHLQAYGERLTPGMWVGVGSVCKRNGAPELIARVLRPIAKLRPDLLLHGFGVKATALLNETVRRLLATADSMAWSFAARKQGRDGNSWLEAKAFAATIQKIVTRPPEPIQVDLIDWLEAAA